MSNNNSGSVVISYREALTHVMRRAMKDHSHTIIMGQGVDDHKGTFGTTLGMAEEFGSERVFDTPLSEEGMTGIGVGLAFGGIYPIHTHIRADFSLLAMNQIINHAAKYRYMSGGRLQVPMMIRLVVGRSWGQGAQHSQSLQSLFSHIPGLLVMMPASADSILNMYPYLISKYPGPVVILEHRLMYDLKFNTSESFLKEDYRPNSDALKSKVVRQGKDVTIAATSIMVLEALRAAEHLAKTSSIDCEVIDVNCTSRVDRELILQSVKKTGRLINADTSWLPFGVGAEVCRIIAESAPSALHAPVVNLGMAPAPCPTAKSLEDLYYPNLQTLSDTIAKLVTGKSNHAIPLPSENSMADVYKKFKGPF